MTKYKHILALAIAATVDWLALAIWPFCHFEPAREFPGL